MKSASPCPRLSRRSVVADMEADVRGDDGLAGALCRVSWSRPRDVLTSQPPSVPNPLLVHLAGGDLVGDDLLACPPPRFLSLLRFRLLHTHARTHARARTHTPQQGAGLPDALLRQGVCLHGEMRRNREIERIERGGLLQEGEGRGKKGEGWGKELPPSRHPSAQHMRMRTGDIPVIYCMCDW